MSMCLLVPLTYLQAQGLFSVTDQQPDLPSATFALHCNRAQLDIPVSYVHSVKCLEVLGDLEHHLGYLAFTNGFLDAFEETDGVDDVLIGVVLRRYILLQCACRVLLN